MEHKYIDAKELKERFKKLCYPVRYDYNFNSLESGMTLTGIRQVIDEMQEADAEPVRHWIPCSERIPKIGENVLCLCSNGKKGTGVTVSCICYSNTKPSKYGVWFSRRHTNVIAWMPLEWLPKFDGGDK